MRSHHRSTHVPPKNIKTSYEMKEHPVHRPMESLPTHVPLFSKKKKKKKGLIAEKYHSRGGALNQNNFDCFCLI